MIKVHDLRCAQCSNPLGLDDRTPGFSWTLLADGRGRRQSAYAIQVAADEKFNYLLWQKKRVESSDCLGIPYGGKSLMACTRYYWRVKVWDEQGQESPWSDTAWFETGLLEISAWKGKWITADPARENKKSAPSPMMRRAFTLPAAPVRARLYITSLGMYDARINSQSVTQDVLNPGWTAYEKRVLYATYDVTDLLHAGENVIGALLGEGWYRGNLVWMKNRAIYGDQRALLAQLHVECADGTRVQIVTDRHWKWDEGPVQYSEIYHGETYDARLEQPGWDAPGFDAAGWQTVRALRKGFQAVCARDGVPVRPIEEIRPVSVFTTPKGETVLDMGQNMVGWLRVRARGSAGARLAGRAGAIARKSLKIRAAPGKQVDDAGHRKPQHDKDRQGKQHLAACAA
jgi:alpha-L-rhamnosidase